MKKTKILQIILWVFALVVIFAVAVIFGWKVFYGIVVPQANNIDKFSLPGLFAFAALAGIMVNFGPCSLAVLPAYMSFYLGMKEEDKFAPVRHSIKLGAIASLGVIGFYIALGFLFATVGTFLAGFSPQLKLVVAFIILVLGVVLLSRKVPTLPFILRFKSYIARASSYKRKTVSLLGFGVVYGAGGLSCFLPVFLPLVFYPFISGKFLESIISFVIFALFQALFLIGAAVLVGLGKATIFKKMVGKSEMAKKIAGVVLILTSIYMFGIFIFLGM